VSAVETILAQLTPERLGGLVRRIAAEQPPGERRSVAVGRLVVALAEGHDLGRGPERSRAYMRLVAAIESSVAQLPEMRYIKAGA